VNTFDKNSEPGGQHWFEAQVDLRWRIVAAFFEQFRCVVELRGDKTHDHSNGFGAKRQCQSAAGVHNKERVDLRTFRRHAVRMARTNGLTRKQAALGLGVGLSALKEWAIAHRVIDVVPYKELDWTRQNERRRRGTRMLDKETKTLN